MSHKNKKEKKLDWADRAAIYIMDKSSTSGRQYYKDIQTELKLQVWASNDRVPTWCGTRTIARALRRAYKKGLVDASKLQKN